MGLKRIDTTQPKLGPISSQFKTWVRKYIITFKVKKKGPFSLCSRDFTSLRKNKKYAPTITAVEKEIKQSLMLNCIAEMNFKNISHKHSSIVMPTNIHIQRHVPFFFFSCFQRQKQVTTNCKLLQKINPIQLGV